MIRLSCIVPAFNEADRIGEVLRVVTAHSLIDEVIVVDDGSDDGTAAVAALFDSVEIIVNPVNKGKSSAVCSGVRAARGSVLLLVDADLVGLSKDHLTDLISPVLDDLADFSISLRQNALSPWKWLGLDYVSGERVLLREVFSNRLEEIEGLPGFGLEVYMNKLLTQRGSRIKVVPWDGVESPRKCVKYGFWSGAAAEMRMIRNIAQTVPLSESFFQINAMLRARV